MPRFYDAKGLALSFVILLLVFVGLVFHVISLSQTNSCVKIHPINDKLCFSLNTSLYCKITEKDVCRYTIDCVAFYLSNIVSTIVGIFSLPLILYILYLMRIMFIRIYRDLTYLENPYTKFSDDVLKTAIDEYTKRRKLFGEVDTCRVRINDVVVD